MTTPHARSVLASPRTLAAWALVAYVAAALFFVFLVWLTPGDGSFGSHFTSAGFRDLFLMAMPVLAVLLATRAGPVVPGARLLTTVALVEYAVSLLFGALTLLVGFFVLVVDVNSPRSAIGVLQYVVLGLLALVLIAVAAYATYRIFLDLGGRLPPPRPAPTAPVTPAPATAPAPQTQVLQPPAPAPQNPAPPTPTSDGSA